MKGTTDLSSDIWYNAVPFGMRKGEILDAQWALDRSPPSCESRVNWAVVARFYSSFRTRSLARWAFADLSKRQLYILF